MKKYWKENNTYLISKKIERMGNNSFCYYEHIPGILGTKTNVDGFFWGFGGCNSPVVKERFDRCKIKVFLEVRPDKAVFDDIDLSEYSHEFRHFKAAPGKNSIIYRQSIKRLAELRYVLTVSGNTVSLTVGRSYLKYIKYKLMYIHPISFILFDVVSLLLLQNSLTTLYCSAVYLPDSKTAVFMAPPNTGKSLCALNLRKNSGAEIVAEDMAVTDGVGLWGASQTNLYRDYKDKTLMDFDPDSFRSKIDKIDVLAILQKSSFCRETIPQDFSERILLINHYSLGYYYSPCVRVLSYYNDDFSVPRAEQTERELLLRMQENAKCLMLENPDPSRFYRQALAALDTDSAGGGQI